ncbi:MAG: tetratricopeptide repeat protein [Promethearchaeota archaeon]
MNKLEKLYNEDFLKDFLYKIVDKLKTKVIAEDLSENIVNYLDKFITVKKITKIQLDAINSICDSLLKNQKDNITCLNLKAIIYYYFEDVVQALRNINNSLKIKKEQFIANYIMANILIEKGSFDLALKFIDKTISLKPECQSCLILKGIILQHKDMFDDAISNFDKVLEKFGPNLSAMAHRSQVLLRLNKMDEALSLSDSVLSIDENNLLALVNKGLILAKNQEYEEAIKVFNKYAENRRDIRILTHLKNCYQKLNNPQKAFEFEKEINKMVEEKRKEAEKNKKE